MAVIPFGGVNSGYWGLGDMSGNMVDQTGNNHPGTVEQNLAYGVVTRGTPRVRTNSTDAGSVNTPGAVEAGGSSGAAGRGEVRVLGMNGGYFGGTNPWSIGVSYALAANGLSDNYGSGFVAVHRGLFGAGALVGSVHQGMRMWIRTGVAGEGGLAVGQGQLAIQVGGLLMISPRIMGETENGTAVMVFEPPVAPNPNGHLILYDNGVEVVRSDIISIATTMDSTIHWGVANLNKNFSGYWAYFKGRLDEAFILDYALTPQQVKTYHADFGDGINRNVGSGTLPGCGGIQQPVAPPTPPGAGDGNPGGGVAPGIPPGGGTVPPPNNTSEGWFLEDQHTTLQVGTTFWKPMTVWDTEITDTGAYHPGSMVSLIKDLDPAIAAGLQGAHPADSIVTIPDRHAGTYRIQAHLNWNPIPIDRSGSKGYVQHRVVRARYTPGGFSTVVLQTKTSLLGVDAMLIDVTVDLQGGDVLWVEAWQNMGNFATGGFKPKLFIEPTTAGAGTFFSGTKITRAPTSAPPTPPPAGQPPAPINTPTPPPGNFGGGPAFSAATDWKKFGLMCWHPDALRGRAAYAFSRGLRWIALLLHDGLTTVQEVSWFSNGFAQECANAGIRVGGWGVQRVDPVNEANLAATLISRYNCSFYIANAEAEYKADSGGVKDRSTVWVNTLQARNPGLPKALSSFGAANAPFLLGHVSNYSAGPFDYIPWFNAGYHFLPQAYANETATYEPVNVADHAARAGWPSSKVHPTIGMYGGALGTVSAASYVSKLDAANTLGFSIYPGENTTNGDFDTFLAGITGAAHIADT